jgi:signal transduction histidine kinase
VIALPAAALAVDLAMEGAAFPLGAAAELAVFQIIQEALTNALRHAAARHVQVVIRYDALEVHVRVADDGAAAPGSGHQGHGITGMRERAALHGRPVHAGPVPGGGWLVTATLRAARPAGTAVAASVSRSCWPMTSHCYGAASA